MLIGYARVSKTDVSQSLDLQCDALRAEGIDDAANLYHDFASGIRDARPGLHSCLCALREGRRARRLEARPPGPQPRPCGQHRARPVRPPRRGPAVLAGQGAQIDTTTAARSPRVRHLRGAGRVPAGADPRTHCGRAQGRTGPRTQGRQQVSLCRKPQARLAQAAMAHRDTSVSELCRELGIRPVTHGQLRRLLLGRPVVCGTHIDPVAV